MPRLITATHQAIELELPQMRDNRLDCTSADFVP